MRNIIITGGDDYDAVNESMYFDNLADVKNYCDDIVCFYSDSDPLKLKKNLLTL